MKISINPVAKPRMTRSDKWKKRPPVLRYRAFSDELRLKLNNFELGNQYVITFGLPFPKSYSKKKCLEVDGEGHGIKPDLDNLIKAFMDSLLDDDSVINEIHARKIWAAEGFIEVGNL